MKSTGPSYCSGCLHLKASDLNRAVHVKPWVVLLNGRQKGLNRIEGTGLPNAKHKVCKQEAQPMLESSNLDLHV